MDRVWRHINNGHSVATQYLSIHCGDTAAVNTAWQHGSFEHCGGTAAVDRVWRHSSNGHSVATQQLSTHCGDTAVMDTLWRQQL